MVAGVVSWCSRKKAAARAETRKRPRNVPYCVLAMSSQPAGRFS